MPRKEAPGVECTGGYKNKIVLGEKNNPRLVNVWDEKKEKVLHVIEVKAGETIRRYVLGSPRKALFVTVDDMKQTIVKKTWLSHQDRELAESLVQEIRKQFLRPEKPIKISADADQPALVEALDGLQVLSQLMKKNFNREVKPPAIPPVCEWSWMNEEERASFLRSAETSLIKKCVETAAGRESVAEEEAKTYAKDYFKKMLHDGPKSRGHQFIKIQSKHGEKMAELWTACYKDTGSSFCHYIEVEPEKRRMGCGTKAMAVWERAAFHQGAKDMRVLLFGKNKPAEKMFLNAGLTTVSTVFRIRD